MWEIEPAHSKKLTILSKTIIVYLSLLNYWCLCSRSVFSPRQFPILGTRYKTVLFPKFADAFLMMYRTAAVGIFTNIGAFGGFCHGNPVSTERVQSGDFGIEKARKRRILGVCRLPWRWQGQKDLNPRHAVLEAMLKFLSRSDLSPILGICCQLRRWCFRNWCFFDDMRNSAPDFWCSWWWIWIPRFGL